MTQTDRAKYAAEHPDSWIPLSAGEILEGEVSDLNVGVSDIDGHAYPILSVVQDNGVELRVFAFSTAMHNEIFMKQPVPGERVTITYHGQGEAKAKGLSAPEIYRLRVHNRKPEAYYRMYSMLQPRGQGFVIPPSIDKPAYQLPELAGELDS